MRIPIGLFVLSAAVICAVWAWLGQPVPMPPSPFAPGQKLDCVSYAPFRGSQSPLESTTVIAPAQYEQDLGRLAAVTGCVRTYSMEFGLETVPDHARRFGLKVLAGLWLSSDRAKNRREIEAAIAVANKHPDVVEAVIVGNEVLLRGELTAQEVAAALREVKSRVKARVTYADVWEFWLRHRELQEAVDFITIHILPYWEDFPIPAREAAAHVRQIRERVATAFSGRELLIGETGWPSAGRMREAALPSPSQQALVIHEILAGAKARGDRVNVIEAFDQPWKRRLEGTVGGYWGLFEDRSRAAKFTWGASVSDHPRWRYQAGAGVLLAALVFGFAAARRTAQEGASVRRWLAVALVATTAGALVGLSAERLALESLTPGDWARSGVLLGLAVMTPIAGATAIMARTPVPGFAATLNRSPQSGAGWFSLDGVLGWGLVLLTGVTIQAALGQVFDPRYRDFPFAPLTAAIMPFFLLAVMGGRLGGKSGGAAERGGAVLLIGCAGYIALNETVRNWQAQWFVAAILALALTLWLVRSGRDSR